MSFSKKKKKLKNSIKPKMNKKKESNNLPSIQLPQISINKQMKAKTNRPSQTRNEQKLT